MPTLEVHLQTNYAPNRDFHYVRVSVYTNGARREMFGDVVPADSSVDFHVEHLVTRFDNMPSGSYKAVTELLNAHLQPVAHRITDPWIVGGSSHVLVAHIPSPPAHIDLHLRPVL